MASPRSGALAPVLATLGVAAAGALAWGTVFERRRFTLRRVVVPVLDEGATPLRILHLSDLHMAPWQHDKQEWVRLLADERPDLVVDTGDNLGHRLGLLGLERALDVFEGVPGVYVHGSNDFFGPEPKNPFKYFLGPSPVRTGAPNLDTAALEAFLDGLGWTNLNNDATTLTLRGTRLNLLGVGDAHRGYDRPELLARAADELEQEQQDLIEDSPAASVDTSTLTIGVTHAPYRRVLDSLMTRGARLLLAGHTHGGQVCLPNGRALVTNCDLPPARVRGLSCWTHAGHEAALHVSAGLGTSIYAPVRFACPPEATLLTLTPAG